MSVILIMLIKDTEEIMNVKCTIWNLFFPLCSKCVAFPRDHFAISVPLRHISCVDVL